MEDFCVYVYEQCWSVGFSSCNVLSGFHIRIVLISYNELEGVPCASHFLGRFGIFSFLNDSIL